jgi:hypothetical protein
MYTMYAVVIVSLVTLRGYQVLRSTQTLHMKEFTYVHGIVYDKLNLPKNHTLIRQTQQI